jgi:CRISPR/Cas system CSM-associated protein Csm2 small subunit
MGAKEALKKYNNVMSKIFDEISDRVDEKNLDIIKDVVNKYAKFLQGN